MLLVFTKFLIPKGFRGLTIYPFVFIRHKSDKKNAIFINHEKIHLRQQLEMLIIPFFIWYFLEFVFRLLQYKNFDRAYLNISFEREAYTKESDLSYLNKKPFFSFLNFILVKTKK
ncbi:hypothetical protein HNQ02_003015 [Flavobacterium sp. 7E]|uniref:hypothetical protein n=1 Tax=Flavobacterium sp. PL002 TaxID=1897058 RepID=UPI0017880418|nr:MULTISPECIES: hypothetical protein [unclassified Flavobacterium]MBE0391487.1 hypothetical protein [Flavobacterium sp. PL002]NRS90080.1 hypothetical protein [Flavobacterium sp. 7E]NRT13726.1 hypothetical protein [Flavobacterium sp. 28A]